MHIHRAVEALGLVSADQFLRTWVPRITGSAAFKQDGLLIVTFDESESGAEDCCNEPSGPNTPNNGGPDPGNGGGRTEVVDDRRGPDRRPAAVVPVPAVDR